MLARWGAVWVDADVLAHATLLPRSGVWRRLKRRFGSDIAQPDGTIDRRRLAAAGFASRRAWRDLCRIIHPAVVARTRQRLRAIRRKDPDAVVVLDVPLLIESGMDTMVDWLVVVTAGRRTQWVRLRRARRWSLTEVRRRLRWQMPLDTKVRRADVVIDNDGSRAATAAQVKRLWQRIQKEIGHG